MLSAKPSCYLTRTFPYLVSKLLFRKSALLHEGIDFVRDCERKVNLFLYFRWHLRNHFPVSASYILHSFNVLYVSIVLEVIVTDPSRSPSFNSSSNLCNVKTYPRNESSSWYVREFLTSPLPRTRILSERRRQYKRSFERSTGRATTESRILPSGRKKRSNAPSSAILSRSCTMRNRSLFN